MRKTTESKLVNFLTSLDKEHIDELIDILTDFESGRIALNSNVKDVLLFEKEISTTPKYSKELIELIITEFQLFSGNSLVNQFRKELVSYDEILNDVYSHLMSDNPYHHSISTKENAVLQKLLGSEWACFDFKTRIEKSMKYNLVIKPNLSSGPNSFAAGVLAIGGKILGRANVFAAAVTSLLSFSTEAYRIMIPFILQISWLKNKYGFYENNGLPVIKEHIKTQSKDNRKIDKDSISTLNQLVSCIPDLLIKKELSKNNIAVLNVPLDQLTPAKDKNGLRAIIMGEKGIVGNARIFEPEKLQNLVNTGILMNLASTLVAQKHLADINQKLNDINEGIESIQNFLEYERKAKITSAYKEAERIHNSLVKGENGIELTLSQHLTSLQQVYDHIVSDINNIPKKIKELQVKKVVESFKDLNQSCNELKLCCNTIMAIYSVYFIKNKEQCYLDRMNNIYEETKRCLDKISNDINDVLDTLFKESKSIFNFDSTELSNFTFIQNRKFDFSEKTSSSLKELDSYSKLFLENKYLEIQVELENGKIKKAYL